MGNIYRISCPECNSLWELHTGNGLIHGQSKKVIAEFPKELQKKAEEEYAEDRMPYFSFRAAVCDKCRAFEAIPVLSDNISGEILVAGFCPKCQNKKVKIKNRPEEELCPACGKSRVTVTDSGNWD